MKVTPNREKLLYLTMVVISLILFYYGYLDLKRRGNPPPETVPYFTDIYNKG